MTAAEQETELLICDLYKAVALQQLVLHGIVNDPDVPQEVRDHCSGILHHVGENIDFAYITERPLPE